MEKEMKRRGPPTLALGVLVPWWFNPLFDLPQRHEDTKNATGILPVIGDFNPHQHLGLGLRACHRLATCHAGLEARVPGKTDA